MSKTLLNSTPISMCRRNREKVYAANAIRNQLARAERYALAKSLCTLDGADSEAAGSV